MATISTRIDDNLKTEAEEIASEIGIPLGTALNIFLKRFIYEKGFPFQVVATPQRKQLFEDDELEAAVKKAIATSNDSNTSHQFTYLDPKSKKYIIVNRKEF